MISPYSHLNQSFSASISAVNSGENPNVITTPAPEPKVTLPVTSGSSSTMVIVALLVVAYFLFIK